MKKREVLKNKDAISLFESLVADDSVDVCLDFLDERYLRRICERYEGILAYKTTTHRWRIYKDTWIDFLTNGLPDIELRQPIMTLPAGLRYLHLNGVPKSYKLREFRKDLKEKHPNWIIKSNTEINKDRISRSHLNKYIGFWNGNR